MKLSRLGGRASSSRCDVAFMYSPQVSVGLADCAGRAGRRVAAIRPIASISAATIPPRVFPHPLLAASCSRPRCNARTLCAATRMMSPGQQHASGTDQVSQLSRRDHESVGDGKCSKCCASAPSCVFASGFIDTMPVKTSRCHNAGAYLRSRSAQRRAFPFGGLDGPEI